MDVTIQMNALPRPFPKYVYKLHTELCLVTETTDGFWIDNWIYREPS
jgi:hypothetical protein